jgi:nucleotide-binding universal stress UspA family protein
MTTNNAINGGTFSGPVAQGSHAQAILTSKLAVESVTPVRAEEFLFPDGPYVMLSYAHDDLEQAVQLAESLRRSDLPCWFDTSIDVGARWSEVLRRRIRGAAALVVLMSPAAQRSNWVELEINEATNNGIRLLPVLLEGNPMFQLSTRQYTTLSSPSDPPPELISAIRVAMNRQDP